MEILIVALLLLYLDAILITTYETIRYYNS